jgi:hypothetical protein
MGDLMPEHDHRLIRTDRPHAVQVQIGSGLGMRLSWDSKREMGPSRYPYRIPEDPDLGKKVTKK